MSATPNSPEPLRSVEARAGLFFELRDPVERWPVKLATWPGAGEMHADYRAALFATDRRHPQLYISLRFDMFDACRACDTPASMLAPLSNDLLLPLRPRCKMHPAGGQ